MRGERRDLCQPGLKNTLQGPEERVYGTFVPHQMGVCPGSYQDEHPAPSAQADRAFPKAFGVRKGKGRVGLRVAHSRVKRW